MIRSACRSSRRSLLAPLFAAPLFAAVLAATPAGAAEAPSHPATISAADARDDLRQLYATLQASHFDLYARVSKADYDRLYRRTLAEIRGPATYAETAVRFQRFVAFGKVAHARIDAIYALFDQHMAGGGKAFPLLIRVVGDKVLVADNRSGSDQVRRGDEITALDGRPIGEWLVLCGRDLSADTPYMAHALMELDLPMLLWLERGPVERFEVAIRRADGQVAKLDLPARTAAEMKAAAKAEPAVLARDANARVARMLPDHVAYLQPGPFYNSAPGAVDEYDNSAFRAFVDGAFQDFLAAGATSLIIDLRDNPGGDSSFSDLMVRWFADRPFRFNASFRIKVSAAAVAANAKRVALAPDDGSSVSARYAAAYAKARPGQVIAFDDAPTPPKPEPRFKGAVYALINRNSYSNTVAVAATMQDYRLGRVIGEETSALGTTYGAMKTFTLAHSGLVVGFPKARIVRPDGDLTPRGVVPDLAIATPPVEGVDDPVLTAAIDLARRRGPPVQAGRSQ